MNLLRLCASSGFFNCFHCGFYVPTQPANVFYKHILKYFFNTYYKGGVPEQITVFFGRRPSNYSVVLGVIGCYNMIYQIASECGVFSCWTATRRDGRYTRCNVTWSLEETITS